MHGFVVVVVSAQDRNQWTLSAVIVREIYRALSHFARSLTRLLSYRTLREQLKDSLPEKGFNEPRPFFISSGYVQ